MYSRSPIRNLMEMFSCAIVVAIAGCGADEARVSPQPEVKREKETREVAPSTAIESNDIKDIISIEFAEDEYEFTLDEVSSGVRFDYTIVVKKDVPDVIPLPQDTGGASGAGPSGLFPFEQISGNGQSYSLHDVGLGPPTEEFARTIEMGSHPLSFEWDGRNWTGPSDFCAPKGDPFPPGTYTLRVSVKGKIKEGGSTRPYEIANSVKVRLK